MPAYDHLAVNRFLETEIDARAIKSALETGLIDRLADAGADKLAALSRRLRIAPAGLAALAALLQTNGVVTVDGDEVALTPDFRKILVFRDLLELRIDFADRVWPDIHELFTPLLCNLPEFMARSRTFALFRYDRCFEATPENLASTREWMRFTTGLTKYEALAALDSVDMSEVQRFVDLGGNSGEFSRALCARHPRMRATVVDLPVVCAIGRAHIDETVDPSVARRIDFRSADMRRDALPDAADLVSFKSVLHDWPEREAVALLERAARIVRPGGRLMIFERAPLDLARRRLTYAMAPDLVFLHFLRSEDLYLRTLAHCGFKPIEYRRIALEVDFHFIIAQLPR